MPCAALKVGNVGVQVDGFDDGDGWRGQRVLLKQVVLDDQAQKQRPGGQHDVDVWKELGPESGGGKVGRKLGNGNGEGGVSEGGDHEVVGDAGGDGRLEDGNVW